MEVINISGKARHGKDTAAKYLAESLRKMNKKVVCVSYADYVKFCAKTYFNWDGKKDETGRALLQKIGEKGRNFHPDFWVKAAYQNVTTFFSDIDILIITDCRYTNEIDFWKCPTSTLRIKRPNYDNGLTEEQQKHLSETQLDDYPFEAIFLNTSIESLHTQIDTYLKCNYPTLY